MISCSYGVIPDFLPHRVNNDFLDDTDNGKDLDDVDFEELNKIGETWAAGSSANTGVNEGVL
jgi:hypothetical protein